jgi:hypothetical protein
MQIDTRKSKDMQHRAILLPRGFWRDSELSVSGSNVSDCSPRESGMNLCSLLGNFPNILLIHDNREVRALQIAEQRDVMQIEHGVQLPQTLLIDLLPTWIWF